MTIKKRIKTIKSKKPLKVSTASTKKKTPNKKIAKKQRLKKTVQKKSSSKKKTPLPSYLGEEAFLASIKPYKLNKKEKYMNVSQKKHFIGILQRWKQMLQFEQDRTVNKIQNNSNQFADEADRATHEEVFTLEIRTRERERRLLSKIVTSLEDLHDGDYGYCSKSFCGVEIGIRRLEARPTASLCIDCKTLEEITEKQNYG